MKKIILSLTVLIIMSNICFAQYNNWNSDSTVNRNAVYINLGYDYSLSLNAGYNYSMNVFTQTVLLGLDYSMPMGENLFDDYKIRIGVEVELLHKNDFYISAKVKGVIRRYEDDYLSIQNYGGDFGLTAGYYKTNWYIAGEFGFDKAITSKLMHTYIYKDIYPEVQDGWYVPTGGQYYYGLCTGVSIKKVLDICFKAGMTNAQGNNVNALLPYYAQIGLNKSF
jgi:hypothetical protein